MCDICGQAHNDMVTVGEATVCASKRHCLIHRLRTADEVSIARLQLMALETALSARQRGVRVALPIRVPTTIGAA